MPTPQNLANAIRALSMDAVQQANSGHPGMPMGMADIAQVLWNEFLQHNPLDPTWPNRDRFILSNGHGSMLHYALLHLSGYDLSLGDLKNFRQLHSKTPGHPEHGLTPGIETTTGPLGQGLANAVGMAIAQTQLAATFNRDHFNLFDHFTYVFVGDGCLMEGISHEVCSLAGTLGLGKLIVLYDDNGISIDGETKHWFTDNTPERFKAYDWHVIDNVDGHDPQQIKEAITAAKNNQTQPSLICCKTTIGFGAPTLAGTAKSHGAPLGEAEIAATRAQIHWPHAAFEIPDEIYHAWDAREKGQQLQLRWQHLFADYQQQYPELAHELQRRLNQKLPANWQNCVNDLIKNIAEKNGKTATRKSSLQCIESFSKVLPELIGGSADLTGSNCTLWKNAKTYSKQDRNGNYIYYGVREFGMSAIANGIALYGGLIPFVGTFLTFSDYARNAVRMSALMQQRVIFVYTHDSIGLGEDGPTHQPIEHVSILRLTPNLNVWRPADSTESAIAWQMAIESTTTPSALLFSRQDLLEIKRDKTCIANIKHGGYILKEASSELKFILIATGSEVELALAAAEKNPHIRIVSMPCCEVFDHQEQAYKDSVLPPQITQRLAIEAASPDYWYKYVGINGKVLGINRFGESAPYAEIYEAFGFTVENILVELENWR